MTNPSLPSDDAGRPVFPAARLSGGLVDVQTAGLLGLLLVLIVGLSLASPYFLAFGNITNILLSVSVIGTMAAASTLVLVSRHLDLSVASIAALAGVLTAKATGDWGLIRRSAWSSAWPSVPSAGR